MKKLINFFKKLFGCKQEAPKCKCETECKCEPSPVSNTLIEVKQPKEVVEEVKVEETKVEAPKKKRAPRKKKVTTEKK